MLYQRLASFLQEVSLASREQKALLAAELLIQLESEMLCPAVRLILGELWPSWEAREMGLGPEAVMASLAEVSKEDLRSKADGEMGALAEEALQRKSQHPLSDEPLQALSVYDKLRRISRMVGPDSEHRKRAILKGLFLVTTPLEAKFIARTALRSMLTGLGPQTMLTAIARAFHYDYQEVQKAYNLMPELGQLARVARDRSLEKIKMELNRPVKPMIIPPGEATVPGAFQPLYPGLMVQVHKSRGETSIFSSRQKNIAPSLDGLCQRLGGGPSEAIIQAVLIGFQDDRILGWEEMVRYINRRNLSRRSRIAPALVAYDLIYLEGEDLTGLAYEERRKRLLSCLGEPKKLPFQGISTAEEKILNDLDAVRDYCRQAKAAGCRGLIERDPAGFYRLGSSSGQDFIIGQEETVRVAIVRAEFGLGLDEGLLVRYRVALRKGEDLAPIAWVSSERRPGEVRALSEYLQALAIDQSPKGVDVRPEVVLALRIRGARCSGEEYRLIGPEIEEIRLGAGPEEADPIERLEKICNR